MKNKGTHFLVQGAAIAAVYVVLTLVFAPLSFGEVQIRFSEALTVLPFFTPAASRDCLWDVSLPIFLAVRFRLTSFSEALPHLSVHSLPTSFAIQANGQPRSRRSFPTL